MSNILGFYSPDQDNGYLSNWYSCSFKYGSRTFMTRCVSTAINAGGKA